jgi:uncharacterized protein involved in exopolysaccharide biosynthesis
MKYSFIPFDLFKQAISSWWLVTLMIIGGFLGLFFHGFASPIFEAQAKFSVTIDYTRTGYLSDIQEDQAMRGIGSLIGSDLILQRTVNAAHSASVDISLDEFRQKSTLERGDFNWFIRFRDKDAQKAADLVNQWADQANKEILEASQHALRTEELFNYLDSIETCLQRTTFGSEAKAPCSFPNLPIILEEIQKTGEIAYQEKEASRGLMSAISISLVEKSQLPTSPVVFNRNVLVLAGSFIGLLIGILITFLWGNDPKNKRLRG